MRIERQLELIVVLCPHIGVLNNVLPALSHFEKHTLDLTLLVLNIEDLRRLMRERDLVKELDRFQPKVFHHIKNCKGFRYEWPSFLEKSQSIRFPSLSYRLHAWGSKKFPASTLDRIAPKTRKKNRCVVFDIFAMRSGFDETLSSLDSDRNISVPHHSGIRAIGPLQPKKRRAIASAELYKTMVLSISALERSWIKESLGVSCGQIVDIGLPVHDPEFLCPLLEAESRGINQKKYILVIGRALNSKRYPSLKTEVLTAVARFATLNDLAIVLKVHPKEKDQDLYERIFNQWTPKLSWWKTAKSPLSASVNALFAVTFGSSTSVDLIHTRCPTAETCDLGNLFGRAADTLALAIDKTANFTPFLGLSELALNTDKLQGFMEQCLYFPKTSKSFYRDRYYWIYNDPKNSSKSLYELLRGS